MYVPVRDFHKFYLSRPMPIKTQNSQGFCVLRRPGGGAQYLLFQGSSGVVEATAVPPVGIRAEFL